MMPQTEAGNAGGGPGFKEGEAANTSQVGMYSGEVYLDGDI